MTAFVLILALCGAVAAGFLRWIFVALVGVVLVPVYVLTMVGLGAPVLPSLGQALLGYVVLQVSFALSGWGIEVVRGAASRRYEDRPDRRKI